MPCLHSMPTPCRPSAVSRTPLFRCPTPLHSLFTRCLCLSPWPVNPPVSQVSQLVCVLSLSLPLSLYLSLSLSLGLLLLVLGSWSWPARPPALLLLLLVWSGCYRSSCFLVPCPTPHLKLLALSRRSTHHQPAPAFLALPVSPILLLPFIHNLWRFVLTTDGTLRFSHTLSCTPCCWQFLVHLWLSTCAPSFVCALLSRPC